MKMHSIQAVLCAGILILSSVFAQAETVDLNTLSLKELRASLVSKDTLPRYALPNDLEIAATRPSSEERFSQERANQFNRIVAYTSLMARYYNALTAFEENYIEENIEDTYKAAQAFINMAYNELYADVVSEVNKQETLNTMVENAAKLHSEVLDYAHKLPNSKK